MALEVVKMKQGMSYSCKEKTIILNVFKYFRAVHPDKCVTEIVRRTAKATGCSEKSVFQFRKEEASAEGFKEPSKTKVRKNININSRFIKYDENVRQQIRSIIYHLKYQNIVPSLSTLLKNMSTNEKLPKFSVMTLRRLLRDMGFYYEKDKMGNKLVLVEHTDVKKENLLCNSKKQGNSGNASLPRIQHTTISNANEKPNEMKQFPLPPPNNIHHSQMYIPSHVHRTLPIPISHPEYGPMDSPYISPRVMPHQMHNMPPHNMKDDLGFMHPQQTHHMILH